MKEKETFTLILSLHDAALALHNDNATECLSNKMINVEDSPGGKEIKVVSDCTYVYSMTLLAPIMTQKLE